MARDEGLEELLREYLETVPGLTEKAMFGGRAWLVNGNLLCAARDDGMLVRLGRDKDGWALEMPDIVPMISRGRRCTVGFVPGLMPLATMCCAESWWMPLSPLSAPCLQNRHTSARVAG